MCNKLLFECNFITNKEVKVISQTMNTVSDREVNLDGFVEIFHSIVNISEEHFWKNIKEHFWKNIIVLYHLDKFHYEKNQNKGVTVIFQTTIEVSIIKVDFEGWSLKYSPTIII